VFNDRDLRVVCVPHAGIAIAQTDKEQEIKRIYKRLIDAENKHDLPAVRALVWNSPSTLFVAKAPVGWHGVLGQRRRYATPSRDASAAGSN
jgi:hypothetical protein